MCDYISEMAYIFVISFLILQFLYIYNSQFLK